MLILFFLVNKSDRMHLIPLAIALTPSLCNLLHLQRNSFYTLFNLSQPCLLLPFSFRCPFTSSINVLFRTLSSFLLSTCPYHFTPFAFAILSHVSFKPSVSISVLSFFSTVLLFYRTDKGILKIILRSVRE